MKFITSSANDKVKLIRSLSDKKARAKHSLFVVEGVNLVGDMPQGYAKELYIAESKQSTLLHIAEKLGIEATIVADFVFEKLSDTVNSQGILALCPLPKQKEINAKVVMVLDGVSDAGNMGTIIRTAVAMGIEDFISINCVDAYSPKVVRSTMGGVYFANIVPFSYASACDALRNYKVAILDMDGENVYDFTPTTPMALVVGSEAHGVSKEMRERADKVLAIPMYGGKIESLNAGVSASIVMSVVADKLKKL
jgi:TrmH family RNA methyltransferase